MKQKLTIASRILIAFASGALVAVFFLPAWRIDLFAPQYAEGLTLNIWINGLSGDVDVINGLNHYIGMKHITVGMFPEFKFLPYVVAFYMLLGMVVAVTGKRRFLNIYLLLTIIGGALAIYDFYQWGYDYGHNLDPMAPIQVPGLSYQPPLFGHKRLLNFDAYSYPDVGGWIVVGASILAFGIGFIEWHRHRKAVMTFNAAWVTAIAGIAFMLSSCSAKPEPLKAGIDVCQTCKMTIMDTRFGSEVVSTKGKLFKFDDVICLKQFLHTNALAQKDISEIVVVNFTKPKEFLPIGKTWFVRSSTLKSPMLGNAAAFATEEEAKQFNSTLSGNIISWQQYFSAN
jgi:copper chaperone NosL